MATVTIRHLPRWTMEYGLRPIAIASCFVIVALLWTFLLQHVIAYPFVFLFFGAIMGSAWFGGVCAGFENRSEEEILLSVEDSGCGIPSELMSRIFEPFFSTKEQGTGMGLAICHSIVEAHDGRIWAENRAEGGAAVRFTLGIKA